MFVGVQLGQHHGTEVEFQGIAQAEAIDGKARNPLRALYSSSMGVSTEKKVLLPTQEMGGQENWIMERMDSFQMLTCQGVWKRNSHGPAMRC